jgi:anhydro-N-acetylmuramic acid kinase
VARALGIWRGGTAAGNDDGSNVDLRVIGMISGTSYDAIDAAVADLSLDGPVLRLVPRGLVSVPMPADVRKRIAALLPPHSTTIEAVTRLDVELGSLFGSVAAAAAHDPGEDRVDLVVSHGQTVFHWVDEGRARGDIQLGSPAFLAQKCGLPVVSDLRNRDIAAGGHGAPLVSLLDALLIIGGDRRRGSLNLGGISNITVADGDGVLAYDIGPSNALMDAAVVALTGGAETYDEGGARAGRGTVRPDLLDRLLTEPYYAAPPPKSTGKELFHSSYLDDMVRDLSEVDAEDLLATLTELTAVVVARACRSHDLSEVVVGGGGVRNPVLMARLAELAAPCQVRLVDEFGLPAQGKEAYAFAVMGYLTVHGLPGTLPGATGAKSGSMLGSVTPGPGGWRLPAPGSAMPTRMVVGSSLSS